MVLRPRRRDGGAAACQRLLDVVRYGRKVDAHEHARLAAAHAHVVPGDEELEAAEVVKPSPRAALLLLLRGRLARGVGRVGGVQERLADDGDAKRNEEERRGGVKTSG